VSVRSASIRGPLIEGFKHKNSVKFELQKENSVLAPNSGIGIHLRVHETFLSRASGTHDWKVAQTGRKECLPYSSKVDGERSSFARMPWEPKTVAVGQRTKSADKSDALQTLRAVPSQRTTRQRLECVRFSAAFPRRPQFDGRAWPGRFIESLLSLLRMCIGPMNPTASTGGSADFSPLERRMRNARTS
jgi:hypothetical protein